MGRSYLVVEGHGEQEAIRNLVTRLWIDLGLPPVVWAPPIRGTDVKTQAGVLKSCEILRSHADCERARRACIRRRDPRRRARGCHPNRGSGAAVDQPAAAHGA
jgi:hypothetical protein